jgi:hypothetical protein
VLRFLALLEARAAASLHAPTATPLAAEPPAKSDEESQASALALQPVKGGRA